MGKTEHRKKQQQKKKATKDDSKKSDLADELKPPPLRDFSELIEDDPMKIFFHGIGPGAEIESKAEELKEEPAEEIPPAIKSKSQSPSAEETPRKAKQELRPEGKQRLEKPPQPEEALRAAPTKRPPSAREEEKEVQATVEPPTAREPPEAPAEEPLRQAAQAVEEVISQSRFEPKFEFDKKESTPSPKAEEKVATPRPPRVARIDNFVLIPLWYFFLAIFLCAAIVGSLVFFLSS
ncbi:MAG: hypothetical protein HY645_04225 [Acidobacteria bacterium]|nr:hypothetical protein [Acidobacteriota bacterium]